MAAKATDLCLASEVAADLGIASDSRVERAVNAAGEMIASYCGRTFERGTVTEYPESAGRPYLMLARPPIISITSITERGGVVTSTDYECLGKNADAGLVLRLSGRWTHTKRLDLHAVSETVEGSYGQSDVLAAVYVGGFVTPGQNYLDSVTYPTVTLPEVVREAAIQTAGNLLKLRGTDPNIKSESIGDWSVSFFDAKTSEQLIPAYARALLAPYRLGMP